MQLSYGPLLHALNETAISISGETLQGDDGRVYGKRETWTIHGFLIADTQAGLEALIAVLDQGYSYNGLTATLYDNVGNIARRMNGTTSIGKTAVKFGPNYPEDGQSTAEFSTFRNYTITVEGYGPAFRGNPVISYNEILYFTGTGEGEFVIRQPTRNLPQRQPVSEATPYHAVQRGQAIGLKDWPVPGNPIWSQDEHKSRRKITPSHPMHVFSALGAPIYTHFKVEWDYEFEAVDALLGQPNLWRP